jgi:hypothetical protein
MSKCKCKEIETNGKGCKGEINYQICIWINKKI